MKKIIILLLGILASQVFGVVDDVNTISGNGVINIIEFYNENWSANNWSGNGAVENVTDWSKPIQTAINELTASKGGIIFLPTGIYPITASIEISGATPITIKGTGSNPFVSDDPHDSPKFSGGTVISNQSDTVVKIIGIREEARNITIRDLTLHVPNYLNGLGKTFMGIADIDENWNDNKFVQRCNFVNLSFYHLTHGIRLLGDSSDGLILQNLKFKKVSKCITLNGTDASTIEKIEAEEFDNVFLIHKASGLLIRDVLAVHELGTNPNAIVFIFTSIKTSENNAERGRAIEVNGVHVEDAQTIAFINASNISFKNIHFSRFGPEKSASPSTSKPAFILAGLSTSTSGQVQNTLNPQNVTFENIVVDWEGYYNESTLPADISISLGEDLSNILSKVDIFDNTLKHSSVYGNCDGLRVINSEINIDIPSTNNYSIINGKQHSTIELVGDDNNTPKIILKENDNGNTAGTFAADNDAGYFTLHKQGNVTINLSGNPIYNSYINSGNFGIGKIDPSEKLDVNGNIKASGNIQGNAVFIDGEKVLGEQEDSISNVLGNSVGDNADAINDILSVLRNHGLIKR